MSNNDHEASYEYLCRTCGHHERKHAGYPLACVVCDSHNLLRTPLFREPKPGEYDTWARDQHIEVLKAEVERLRAENAALRQERATDDKGLVWAVVYGNYFPEEVDSLWATEVLAQERADELGGDWQVTTKRVWQSRKEYVGEEPTDAD